jgi:hypothetical protein
MVVPYGDRHINHARKNAFDCGEYGIGMLANALQLGCDCLGEIKYFDAYLADSHGKLSRCPNVVCMHEEDYGIGWKHVDWRTNSTEVRRSRRLVVSFISTVGNYEYGFFWYLYQDGTIQFEIKLTGIMNLGALHPVNRGLTAQWSDPACMRPITSIFQRAPRYEHRWRTKHRLRGALRSRTDGAGEPVWQRFKSGRDTTQNRTRSHLWIVTVTMAASGKSLIQMCKTLWDNPLRSS